MMQTLGALPSMVQVSLKEAILLNLYRNVFQYSGLSRRFRHEHFIPVKLLVTKLPHCAQDPVLKAHVGDEYYTMKHTERSQGSWKMVFCDTSSRRSQFQTPNQFLSHFNTVLMTINPRGISNSPGTYMPHIPVLKEKDNQKHT